MYLYWLPSENTANACHLGCVFLDNVACHLLYVPSKIGLKWKLVCASITIASSQNHWCQPFHKSYSLPPPFSLFHPEPSSTTDFFLRPAPLSEKAALTSLRGNCNVCCPGTSDRSRSLARDICRSGPNRTWSRFASRQPHGDSGFPCIPAPNRDDRRALSRM